MATKGLRAATLADVTKRTDPNGSIAKLVEQMNQTNEALDDMLALEGNLPTGHRTTVRTGLASATWRELNRGVQPSKSTTTQVDDTCGMLEAYAQIDKSLADLNGNAAEWRLSEDMAFIEAMNQEMARTLFYGNSKLEPKKFMGLAPYYNALTGHKAAENVFSAGGTGSTNTSVWLVGWGENTVHSIYPKGSNGGLKATDLGEETLQDEDGGLYQGYRTHYKWDIGLCLRDWRYAARICNIDTSEFPNVVDGSQATVGTWLIRMMIAAHNKIPNQRLGKLAWYMNNDVKTIIDIMAMEKTNVHLTIDMFEGKPITRFRGIPIRRVDQIVNTEAAVS